MQKLTSRFSRLFNEKVHKGENIPFNVLYGLARNEEVQLMGFNVIGTVVDKERLVFYDDVVQDSILDYHYHSDCDEVVHCVSGEFILNDMIILRGGDRRYIHKNESHKLKCVSKRGKLIVHIVKNDG